MARKKSRTKQMLFSASSEMRKGFTMPTIKKIKSVLMKKSKTFLVNLIISMMAGMSKTAKVKILVKIEKGKIVKRAIKRRRKAKSTRKGQVRKTARRAYKKTTKSKGRKGKGFQGKPKGSQAEKKAIAKAQRARKRR